MKILTIAIPTYNRKSILDRKLGRLREVLSSSQFGDRVGITVLDNCSDFPLNELIAKYPDVHFIRNRCNIGMVSNILRCVEYCETNWCWVLGDDDKVEDNCIDNIINTIKEHRDCCLINFKSNLALRGVNDTEKKIDSMSSVFNFLDYSNLLLISNNVISTNFFKKKMDMILSANDNMFHYLNALPKILSNGDTYILRSNKTVVEWLPSTIADSWSREYFYSNAPSFLGNVEEEIDKISGYTALTQRSAAIKPLKLRELVRKYNILSVSDIQLEIRKNIFVIQYSKNLLITSLIKIFFIAILKKSITSRKNSKLFGGKSKT